MRIFWKKTVKKIASVNPRLPPAAGGSSPRLHIATFTYYYNFVEFIFQR